MKPRAGSVKRSARLTLSKVTEESCGRRPKRENCVLLVLVAQLCPTPYDLDL